MKEQKRYNWEFWAVPKLVLEDESLKAEEKILLGILCTLTNGENRNYPRTSYLAKILKCRPKTVRYYIQSLEKRDWISIKRNNSNQIEEFKISVSGVVDTNGAKNDPLVDTTPNDHEYNPTFNTATSLLLKKEENMQDKPAYTNLSEIEEIISSYSKKIKETKKISPLLADKVKSCLKTFSKEELLWIIDWKSGEPWFMENCAWRGATWFFKNKNKLQEYLDQRK